MIVIMDRRAALELLFKKEYPALIQKAYRLTADRELSQDLVQDTFVLAFAHWEELVHHPAPGGWLTLTLFNLVRNERRKLARHQCLCLDDVQYCLPADERASLEEILPSRLSNEDKRILLWYYEQQLSYTEIALRLGVSENACRMRVSRALKKCRQFLGK